MTLHLYTIYIYLIPIPSSIYYACGNHFLLARIEYLRMQKLQVFNAGKGKQVGERESGILRGQFILTGKWPRQDKFQFSQLEIGGHQKCKREQQFEPDKVSTTWNSSCFYSSLTLTRSFVASTTAAFDPPLLLIQLLIISVDETTTFQGENTIEKASRKDPPFQMRRHMMITIAAQLSFQNSWSFQKKG